MSSLEKLKFTPKWFSLIVRLSDTLIGPLLHR